MARLPRGSVLERHVDCSTKADNADDAGSLQKMLKRNRNSHVIKPISTRKMVLTPSIVLWGKKRFGLIFLVCVGGYLHHELFNL